MKKRGKRGKREEKSERARRKGKKKGEKWGKRGDNFKMCIFKGSAQTLHLLFTIF